MFIPKDKNDAERKSIISIVVGLISFLSIGTYFYLVSGLYKGTIETVFLTLCLPAILGSVSAIGLATESLKVLKPIKNRIVRLAIIGMGLGILYVLLIFGQGCMSVLLMWQ